MRRTDPSCAIATRRSSAADSAALGAVAEAAWRWAYAGVIPEPALSRMTAARGAGAWRRLHARGGSALALEVGGAVAGYAMPGPARDRRFAGFGEIRELYIDPAHAGCGLGRMLFEAARAGLAPRCGRRLVVKALADNALATRFYAGLGGRPVEDGATVLGGVRLPRAAFVWD